MNQSEPADIFKQKLEEARAAEREKAFPMVFAGFPCRVRPLSRMHFINAGRMPEHLTEQIIRLSDEESGQATERTTAHSAAEAVASENFMRFAVCAVLVEPQVVEAEPVPEGGYLYATLFITAPAFCRAVYQWVLDDCPAPKEEKGEGVLGVEDLERFPAGAEGVQRADAGDQGEGRGAPAIGAITPD